MDVLHGLSVGQVSGIIAVGTALVAFTTPLLISILLVRWQGRAASAATWSVIARQVQSSAWPSFLRTDSVAAKSVETSVSLLAYLGAILSLLTVIAGIVTPLGLREAISSVGTRDVSFSYVPDLSSYGLSTQRRSNLPLSRDCVITSAQCPGAIVENAVLGTEFSPEPNPDAIATTRIPENITALFTSATNSTTIASIFDIQYRTWKRTTSQYFDGRAEYQKGSFRAIENLILRENITLVEGVVADFASGGIGYRNHSLPTQENQGAQWTEDILWVEPEYACTNTNLSLVLTLGETFGSFFSTALESIDLVDDGGFARLQIGDPYRGYPNINYSNPNPRLRADRAAWLHNFLAAMVFNVTDTRRLNYSTNATEGTHYPLSRNNTFANGLAMRPLTDFLLASSVFDLPNVYELDNGTLGDSFSNATRIFDPPADYPYYFASWLFEDLPLWCSGQGNNVSINNEYNVECGYLFGHPQRIDGGSWLEEEARSVWKIPIYVAAGALTASIKTVTFASNGSTSLQDMSVTKIEDKLYDSADEHPLWAIEDWWFPGYEGAYTGPLWGIVADSYEGTQGYNFTRAPRLYLPASMCSFTWSSAETPSDSLAGAVAPYCAMQQVLRGAFDPEDTLSTAITGNIANYGGLTSAALRAKWYNMSQTEEGAEQMLRLVWTDIVTSATIGANMRSDVPALAATQDEEDLTQGSSAVTVYARRITYDLRYAVPAILTLALWALLGLATILISLLRRYRPSNLIKLLNETSVGRAAVRNAYPEGEAYATASTNLWLKGVGHFKIKLGDRDGNAAAQGGDYEMMKGTGIDGGKSQISSNQMLLREDNQ